MNEPLSNGHLGTQRELQIDLVGITFPVTHNLDQFPRNTVVEGPGGTSSAKGMASELGSEWHPSSGQQSTKNTYKFLGQQRMRSSIRLLVGKGRNTGRVR